MVERCNAPITRSFLTDSFLTDSFLTDSEGGELHPLPLILPLHMTPLAPEQEQLRVLLISSRLWVRETIHDLHGRGFADPNDWSSLLPGASPGEFVSILARRRRRP